VVSETVLTKQTTDYERIARAIKFITSRVDGQPSLEEVAADQHLSPFHFQRLFSRWAGVTPKRFLQVLTVDRAKQLLDESRPVLEVSNALGLSSGSRLHDHFVQLEAITPGEYKTGGEGLAIEFGVHDTPFGMAFVAATPRGVCNLAFLDDVDGAAHLERLAQRWPRAVVRENDQRTGQIIDSMFAATTRRDGPLSLHVLGTNFQINVWRALLEISPGAVTSYSTVAARIGRPTSARAVGRAVGMNPVAFLIPCHRVIQQSGDLGGYHWGVTRKQAIHAWEAARST
jgi:AraC family transcriptional regulator of adaptative response/methylated-DNA-[protein]-cysteine methyltransferase